MFPLEMYAGPTIQFQFRSGVRWPDFVPQKNRSPKPPQPMKSEKSRKLSKITKFIELNDLGDVLI